MSVEVLYDGHQRGVVCVRVCSCSGSLASNVDLADSTIILQRERRDLYVPKA